jgi:hypothetical protein
MLEIVLKQNSFCGEGWLFLFFDVTPSRIPMILYSSFSKDFINDKLYFADKY